MANTVETKIKIDVQANTKEAQKDIDNLVKETEKLNNVGSQQSGDFTDSFFDNLPKYKEEVDQIGDAVQNYVNKLKEGNKGSGGGFFDQLVDTKELSKVLKDVVSSGKININTFQKLGKAVKFTGGELAYIGAAAAIAYKGLKLINDNAKDLNNNLSKLSSAFGSGAIDSIGWFIDSIQNLTNVLQESFETLQEFSEYGLEVQNSYKGLANSIGGDAVNSLGAYADNLEQMIGLDATGIITDINKLSGALQQLGGTEDQIAGAGSALYELALNMHGANPELVSTSKALEDINKAILTGKVSKKNADGLIRILGADGVDQFNKLNNEVDRYNFLMEKSSSIKGAYLSYLNTEAGRIEVLNQQYSSFQGNLGQIALHLYAQVAPVLTQILKLANSVLSSIMSIFNIDVKNTSGITAIGGIADDFEDVADSAKKANKQVASFDDVIQISDKSSSMADVGDLSQLEEFGGLVDGLISDTEDLTDAWYAFNEALKNGDYASAGAEFMKVIGKQLGDIPWDDIKTKAGDAGKVIGDFINNMTNLSDAEIEQAWKNIGITISESINTVIEFISKFLKTTDFKQLGEALGVSWKALWDNLDTDEAGELLYNAFIGIFDFALGWLKGGGLSKVATSISDIIKSFFGQFTDVDQDTIVSAVEGVIDDVINALYIIVEALTSDEVKGVVLSLIQKLVTSFKDNAGEWGTKLGTALNDILDFIIDMIDTADDAGIMDAITKFLDGLDLSGLLAKWMQLKLKLWWEKTKLDAIVWFEEVGMFLVDGIKKMLLVIVSIITIIGSAIIIAFKWVFTGAKNIIEEVGFELKTAFEAIVDFIKKIFSPDTWKNIGKDFINGLWNGIKSAWNSTLGTWKIQIPDWIPLVGGNVIQIPQLATGGIVNGSTIANIGEAGAEAVLPLENNTGWMDRLATKLADKINNNNGSSNNSITLDMRGYTKNFYTRTEMYEFGAMVVEALKVYGVNISLVS